MFRKSLGFSQKQLADLLGISQGYVGDVEANRCGASTKFITLMLQKTNVSADWLLTGEGPTERGALEGASIAREEEGTVLYLPPISKVDENGAPYDGIGALKDRIKALIDRMHDKEKLKLVVVNCEVLDQQEVRLEQLEQQVEELRRQSKAG